MVRVSFPPLTEERRKELVKVAKKMGEDARIAVRSIRRDANDHVKKLEKSKEISEDDSKGGEAQIQKATDAIIARIDELGQEKRSRVDGDLALHLPRARPMKSLQIPLEKARLPRHVAIIMDGNGRWAKKRGLPRVAGHKVGLESVRAVVKACSELGIPYLTLYAFSSENWRRPSSEVGFLMRLLEIYLRKELRELHSNNVRINAIGHLEELPGSARKELEASRKATAKNSGLTLTLALNYGGRRDILDGVLKAAQLLKRAS